MRSATSLPTVLLVLAAAVSAPVPAPAQPDTKPFLLTAHARPEVVPLGGVVEFFVTVTNAGNTAASFGVDGCPVHYSVNRDGLNAPATTVFTPQWGCAEFWREITLEPGEAVTFGPEDHGGLRLGYRQFPLAPGVHVATFWVPDIGREAVARARFRAADPAPDQAYLAGRFTGADGYPVHDGTVVLHGLGPDDTWPDSSDVPPGETHQVKVGEFGYWYVGGIRPGTFRIEGRSPDGQSVFYGADALGPGVPVPVGPGEYRDHLDLSLLPGPPPPPPPPPGGVLRGVVYEDSFTDGPPVPIPGAIVRAFPVGSDTAGPSPDGTLPGPFGYLGIAADDGTFAIKAPTGPYILVAGHPGYSYRYWNLKDTWNEADVAFVYPDGSEAPEIRHTMLLWPDLIGDPAVIRGQVLGHNPMTDVPPHPVPNAVVRFFPLVGGFERVVLLQTTTDENGFYEVHASPHTPYFVQAGAEGYRDAFHGPDPRLPAGVDVRQGETTAHVDVLLTETGFYGQGSVTGFVFEPAPDCDRASGCMVPAVGATVRVEAAYPTFAPYVRTAIVGRDGSFRVDDLAADPDGSLSYYVSALRRNSEAFYYPGGVTYDQAVPLPVFPGQAADAGRILMGRTEPPGTGFIAGRLVDTAEHGVPHGLVKLYGDDGAGDVLTVHTDAEGWFHFNHLPLGKDFVLAGAAEGFVPSYHPGVALSRAAERVQAAGPNALVAPVVWTLHRQAQGVYLQAGRVQVAGDPTDGGGVDPAGDPGILALAHHRRNVPHALFYVVNAQSASPVDIPVAGGFTGDNGTVILTELPPGSYIALADRPGFAPARFQDENGSPRILVLDAGTPAVLAEIDLRPDGWVAPPGETGDAGMVTGMLNAPNPFSPRTTIRFTLHETAAVCVEVFDFRGRLVRTLLARQTRQPGLQSVPWDGTDERGLAVPSGVYFYRVEAGTQRMSRKMVLLPR